MREGIVGAPGVVHCLAEGEIEMKPILAAEFRRLQRLLHRREVSLVELDGLEVRKAPPGIAQRWLQ